MQTGVRCQSLLSMYDQIAQPRLKHCNLFLNHAWHAISDPGLSILLVRYHVTRRVSCCAAGCWVCCYEYVWFSPQLFLQKLISLAGGRRDVDAERSLPPRSRG